MEGIDKKQCQISVILTLALTKGNENRIKTGLKRRINNIWVHTLVYY